MAPRAGRYKGIREQSKVLHVLSAVVLSALVVASPGWEDAASDAKTVKNLGRFLETYVGECERDDPKLDKASCRRAIKEVRREWTGKRLLVQIDDLEGLTKIAGKDRRSGKIKVDLVPLFAERVLGMTIGRPRRVNADGQPILRTVRLLVERPSGMPEFIFKKKLKQARLELVVKPKRTWLLKHDDENLQGVEVTPVALRLLEGRGDGVLAEKVFR